MSKLRSELDKARRNIPFVYELYPKDNRDGLQEFLTQNNDSIVISYDAKGNDLFLAHWIDEIYKHYNMEAPDKIKQYKKLGMDFTKVGLFAAGFALSGGASIALSFLGSGITIFEKINEKINNEENNREEAAVNALKLFSKEKDNIAKPELLILGGIRLLYQLSKIKNIIFHITNPQNLSDLDIQFIRLYYNLFKDKSSRIQFHKEVDGYNEAGSKEAESSILIIFDWNDIDPDKLDDLLKDEQKYLMKFRWFLRRYKMVDDLKGDILNQVVGEDTFVGRANILNELKDDFRQVFLERRIKVKRIQGNSGMGKTTLANQFVNKILSEDFSTSTIILRSGYSGENVNFRGGLTEIRTAINQLKIRTDSSLRKNIEEKLYSSYESNIELINWFKEKFDNSCEIESLITPLMELAGGNLGIAGKILSTISTAGGISDIVGAAKSSVESYLIKRKPEIITKEEHKDIEAIVNDLYLNFIDICEKNKAKNTIVWVIDDLQWIDVDSVKFFNKIIKNDYFQQVPIYIVFLEREADFSSRLRSSKEKEILKELEENLSLHTIKLKGFAKDEIKSLLIESVNGNAANEENANLVADMLWNWFVRLDEKQSIEPLFLVESIILLTEQEEDNKILSLNHSTGKWEWIDENIDEIDNRISKILSNWSEETSSDFKEYGFTPSGIAIMEERLYRLKNHFTEDMGYTLINMLEVGAFMGEPFILNAAVSYIQGLKENSDNVKIDLDEIENIYGIVLKYSRYVTDDKLLAYLYSHSLYKQFMNLRFKKDILNLPETHSKVFECIDYLLSNQEIRDDIVIDVYGQAVQHAILSNDPENYEKAIGYALLLADIYNKNIQPRKELLYYKKALKLCKFKDSEFDYIKNIINHKIVKLYYDFGEYDAGIEIINHITDKYKGNIGFSLPFKKLEITFLQAISEFEEAEKKGEDLLWIIGEVEGKDSEAYKIAMDNQAQTLVKLGKVEKAKEIQEELLNWSINNYGNEHSETLIFKDNLAYTYNMLGDCEDAIRLEKEVYSMAKDVWGEKSKHRINNMVNLSGSLMRIRRFEEALEICEEAYALAKSIYSERNPLTLRAMTNLAVAYRGNGLLNEAVNQSLKVIEIKESLYTKEHLEVITSKNNLARIYIDMGDLENARKIQEDVVKAIKEIYPQNINDRIVCLLTLHQIYRMQKKYNEAKACIEEVNRLYKDMPDSNIIKIRGLLEGIKLYYELGETHDSILLSKKVLLSIMDNKLYNMANFEFASVMESLIILLFAENRNSEIVEIGERIINDKNIKLDDNLQAFVCYYLSFAYLRSDDFEKAKIFVEKSLENLAKLSEVEPTRFADYIYLKGIIQRKMGNYGEALRLCKEAEQIYIDNGKGESHNRYDLLIEISMIHMLGENWLNAARNQRDVITLGDKILKENDKDRIIQRERICSYYYKLQNWGRGRKVIGEALDLAQKYYPNDTDLINLLINGCEFLDKMYNK